MRIALVNTLYSPLAVGGAARSVEELAAAFAAEGHKVMVATLGPEDRQIDPDTQPPGVVVERLPAGSAFEPFDTDRPDLSKSRKLMWHARETRRPTIERELASSLDAFDADVVHTNNIAGFGLSAWRAARGRPLVHTMRDYYLVCTRSALFRDGEVCTQQCTPCRALKSPIRLVESRPDVFVGVSQAVVDQHYRFRALGHDDRAEVIYNWPNLSPSPRAPIDASHSFTFGMLGRMGRDKGNWLAFEAYSDLPDNIRSRTRMLLAGYVAAEDQWRLDAFLAAEPGAEYLGSNVPATDFYASTDCVLIPAQWMEPFGRVAAEALLAGCSVVASRIGGLPEAIKHFGGGMLVDEMNSVAAWTAAMVTAAQDGPKDPAIVRPKGLPVHESYLAIYRDLLQAQAE